MNQNGNLNDESSVDSVTRQQGGQFISESPHLFAPSLENDALAGEGDAQLSDADTTSVHALQVNMERSGADFIQSQKSFLTQSGAREIHSDTAKLTESGVLSLKADTVDMKKSSSVITRVGQMTASESRFAMSHVDTLQAGEDIQIGLVNATEVRAEGDIRSFLVLGSNIQAGGNVTSTLDANSAGIAAAAFAGVLFLLSRIFRRK